MEVVLALGGGGAKGAAHIPVLEALDDLGLRPKAIAGTSIGALVGGAYAAGHSGAALRAHAETLMARRAKAIWTMVKDPRNKRLQGLLSPEAAVELGVPEAGIPETFEELQIPFISVATDFYEHEAVGLHSGPLMSAIAASIAIPAVFLPMEIDGRTLVDGGLTQNVPVSVLPEGFLIAVDVLDYPDEARPPGRIRAGIGAVQIMIKAAMRAELAKRPPDLLLEPDTGGVGPLDFGRLDDILASSQGVREEVKRALGNLLDQA